MQQQGGGGTAFDFGSAAEMKVGVFDDSVNMRSKGKGQV